MSSATVRTVLPLAALTCTGMLAMDLYLPAVPVMQRALDLTVAQGQASITVFLAGLAASQLAWGDALHRWSARRCTAFGLALLVIGSIGCALADDVRVLLLMRLLQGVGGGVATVVVPAVIKGTLGEDDAHRGIAAVSMIEAIVPAAGPVLGTLLLLVVDWRWTFGIVALLTLAAAPFALRASPAAAPAPGDAGSGYAALLRDGRFVRLALAHALCVAALFVFVASGPQVLNRLWGAHAFAVAQVVGVAAFIVAASQSSRMAQRMGRARAVRAAGRLHAALCAAFALLVAAGMAPYGVVLAFWALFCGTLGVRGPAAFSDALSVPRDRIGRASGLLVLLVLVCAAAATQLVAFFLDRHGLLAVSAGMAVSSALSVALLGAAAGRRAAQAEADPGRP